MDYRGAECAGKIREILLWLDALACCRFCAADGATLKLLTVEQLVQLGQWKACS